MKKTIFTIGLVAAGLCTVALPANRKTKTGSKHQAAVITQVKHITVDPKVGYYFKTDSKTTYRFNKTNAIITDLIVNGKRVPDAQAGKYRPQIDALLKQYERTKVQENAVMDPIAPLPPLEPDANLIAVTNALIKQRVIKDEDSYDLTINDKYLIVDGVKQPEELHQQMLKKLEKKPGGKASWTFSYHK